MVKSSEDQASLENIEENLSISSKNQQAVQKIGRPPEPNRKKGTMSDLTKLYKLQSEDKTEWLNFVVQIRKLPSADIWIYCRYFYSYL